MRHEKLTWTDSALIWMAVAFFLMSPTLCSGDAPDTNGRQFVITAFASDPSSVAVLDIVPQLPEIISVNITAPFTVPPVHLTFTLQPRMSQTVSLPPQVLLREDGINNKGVLLTASADVSVVLRYENQSDSCLILPSDVLGTNYSILSAPSTHVTNSVLIISASSSASDAVINISGDAGFLSGRTVGTLQPGGEVLTVELSPYKTLVLTYTGSLSGLTVTSDQPIAVWTGGFAADISLSEMVPPASAWGRKFILVSPANQTTATVLVRSNSTLTVQSDAGMERHGLVAGEALTLTFHGQSFVYMYSNLSALVLQTSFRATTAGDTWGQMFYVPPVEQYLNQYSFSVDVSCHTVCLRAVSPSTDTNGFLLDGKEIDNFVDKLSFVVETESYTILGKDAVASGLHEIDHVIPTRAFSLYAGSESELGFRPVGMRVARLYDSCVQMPVSEGGLGDGLDNDCDGLVDEELLNDVDDDTDGFVDEDTARTVSDSSSSAGTTASDSNDSVDDNVIAVVVSLTVAIGAILLLIGSCLLHDFLKRRQGTTRISPFVS